MGTNIHLHQEVKINGKWHHYGIPNVGRNYRLFARMANVRNKDEDIVPIAMPRGLPRDATELTIYDYKLWDNDGYSHSFLTAKEIKELKDRHEDDRNKQDGCKELASLWFENYFGYLFENRWTDFIEYPEGRPKGLEDIRFIFWFDN